MVASRHPVQDIQACLAAKRINRRRGQTWDHKRVEPSVPVGLRVSAARANMSPQNKGHTSVSDQEGGNGVSEDRAGAVSRVPAKM